MIDLKIVEKTETYSVLDITREDLAELFYQKGYKIGAEIGVRQAEYSKILLDNNPGLKLYCIDPWSPYDEIRSNRKQDRYYNEAFTTLSKYGQRVVIVRKTSADALSDIPDETLDFVYIDAAHDEENFSFDLNNWDKKVRIGGMISGHDYFEHPRRKVAVKYVLDNFVREIGTTFYITNERYPSYFWAKERNGQS